MKGCLHGTESALYPIGSEVPLKALNRCLTWPALSFNKSTGQASWLAPLAKNLHVMQDTSVWFPWRRDRLPTPVFLCFPWGSDGTESMSAVRETWVQPLGWEDPSTLQYSCPENPHGQRSLEGHSSRGHKESDVTETKHSPARKHSMQKWSSAEKTEAGDQG